MNFWYEPQHITWTIDLITVFLMGIVHGITPDEHTWPITFSYSIGSYSTKGGVRAGMYFSLAFMLQRAIASELAYFALAGFLMRPGAEEVIYVVVGIVMLMSGYFILHRHKTLHLFPWLEKWIPPVSDNQENVPVKLALVHGFIAGWGTGAFATIIYTMISPRMPSAWIAFLPGLLYGLGTMAMQILIGGMFGRWIAKRGLGQKATAFIGRYVAGNTLWIGGILFALAGIAELISPNLAEWGLPTGLRILNLDSLNLALLLVIVIVGGTGGISIWRAMKKVRSTPELY